MGKIFSRWLVISVHLFMGVSMLEAVQEPSEPEELRGVVVESVGGWALTDAGIQEGDVLLSWERLPNSPMKLAAAGEIKSYFEWLEIEVEQAPRGTVVLEGRRGELPMMFTVEPGLWDVEVRPVLPRTVEGVYPVAKAHLDAGGIETAESLLRALVEKVEDKHDGDLHAWISLRIGEAWAEQGAWDKTLNSSRGILADAINPSARIAAWLAAGTAHRMRNEFKSAEEAYASALGTYQVFNPQSLGIAKSLEFLGVLAWEREDLDLSHDYFLQALRLNEQLSPRSLPLAGTLNNLGNVAWLRGDLNVALEYHRRALQLHEQLAPQGLLVANSYNSLGTLEYSHSNLDLAKEYFLKSLQLREQLVPQSLEVAESLNNLGLVEQDLGDLDHSYEYQADALYIKEQLMPKSITMARSLNNLGTLALERGFLDVAGEHFLRALRLLELLAPDSITVAIVLNNLGLVASHRADFDRANDWYLKSKAILEKIAPQSAAEAANLINLGMLAQNREQWDQASDFYLRTLSILEEVAPQSLTMATNLNNLGCVVQAQGNLESANNYHQQAMDIREEIAPWSLAFAAGLGNLGDVAQAAGNLNRAYDYFLRALQIQEQLAPGGREVANSQNKMGDVAKARGDSEQSFQHYNQALEALDHQVSKLGGSYNVQVGFRVQHSEYYRDMLDFLLSEIRFIEVFQLLERFRAQTFLTMLAERDTVFTADVPKKLDRERRQLAARYESTQTQLAGLNLRENSNKIGAIRRELERLHNEAGDLEARIRSTSPRLAALQYPQPLDIIETQKVLDAGTLLLSYSVGEEQTALFALSPTKDLQTHILSLGKDDLRTQVERLLTLANERPIETPLSKARQLRLREESRALYKALLEPAAEQIAASERLLILPDGPLHALPFAALIHQVDEKGEPRYLVEWKPLHVALSATVYAELKEWRRPKEDQTPLQIVAFGDPEYPKFTSPKGSSAVAETEGKGTTVAEAEAKSATISETKSMLDADGGSRSMENFDTLRGDAVVRSAAERGIFDWAPLPNTRREVEAIAELFPKGSVRTYLGLEALEERVKSLDKSTRILHIASHVHTNDHLPMSSFVALTINEDPGPGQDNGLLQVWEIFERVRLDADLVVLSACESGLGKEQGPEGLIGLTRAFHYAGARSVIASLWNVPDQTTAELMIRFYRHLRSGLTKDEALRAAQLELIRGPIEFTNTSGEVVRKDASSPYYWAAFQVFGDWQ